MEVAGSWWGGTPSGAVMFFNLSSCPSGWSEMTSAQGRYIVGLPSGGNLAGTVGTALTNTEDRPTGMHNHSFGMWWAVPNHGGPYTEPAQGCCTEGGTAYTSNAGSVGGTNAPYIQLLVCQKD